MKQIVTQAQLDALPRGHQERLAKWCHERDYYECSMSSKRFPGAPLFDTQTMGGRHGLWLTLGVLLEFLAHHDLFPMVDNEVAGVWSVLSYHADIGPWNADNPTDALWAAVVAVLAVEVPA